MKLPDDTYVENGITYLLTDRELVERVIIVKRGKKDVAEKYSYVVSTRIRDVCQNPAMGAGGSPGIHADALQRAEASKR